MVIGDGMGTSQSMPSTAGFPIHLADPVFRARPLEGGARSCLLDWTEQGHFQPDFIALRMLPSAFSVISSKAGLQETMLPPPQQMRAERGVCTCHHLPAFELREFPALVCRILLAGDETLGVLSHQLTLHS